DAVDGRVAVERDVEREHRALGKASQHRALRRVLLDGAAEQALHGRARRRNRGMGTMPGGELVAPRLFGAIPAVEVPPRATAARALERRCRNDEPRVGVCEGTREGYEIVSGRAPTVQQNGEDSTLSGARSHGDRVERRECGRFPFSIGERAVRTTRGRPGPARGATRWRLPTVGRWRLSAAAGEQTQRERCEQNVTSREQPERAQLRRAGHAAERSVSSDERSETRRSTWKTASNGAPGMGRAARRPLQTTRERRSVQRIGVPNWRDEPLGTRRSAGARTGEKRLERRAGGASGVNGPRRRRELDG